MEGRHNQRRILIVDDDRGLLRLIEQALQREGFATATASSGKEALAWLAQHRADLLVLDLKLQDIEGKELIQQISGIQPVPFIIITGQGDERVAVDMMKQGARDYLVKDVEFLQFVPEVVKHVLEQIDTERRLEAAEEQVNLIQNVVEQGFSAVLIADANLPDPTILYINPSFAKFTGFQSSQVVGKRLSALSPLNAVRRGLQQAALERERFLEEISPYATSEGERWAEWRIGPVKDKAGRTTHWLVILRDITERKRLEKEILEINDRVQGRIGQDLHDGLCQQLAGIELMSQVLEQKLASRSKADAARIGEIAGHVRDAISQTRLLARGLSPITLEFEGLMSGLQELASNTEKIFRVACVFQCDTPVLLPDQTIATHLFRIAQEAVSNAIRHGKAKRIVIKLARRACDWCSRSRTTALGFPQLPPSQKGMGLRIMQSRSALIGGVLAVENNPAGGVTVTCSVAFPGSVETSQNENSLKKENPSR